MQKIDALKIDARGQLCPHPVLKLRKALQSIGVDETIELIASDPMSAVDIPHFCHEEGHQLIAQHSQDNAWHGKTLYYFTVEKRTT